MHRFMLRALGIAILLAPAVAIAQSPKATYIPKEDIDKVNALPGVDRQIHILDIGKLNEEVGIIHRGPTGAARGAAARGGARGAAGRGGGRAGQVGAACGEQSSAPAPANPVGGIAHYHQTENYVIVSGGGTLVTGGHIVNGRESGPESEVTTTLNGPSCSGRIEGADVVRRDVKVGDVVVIPANTPHGWANIPDHVDYLSIRPDPDRVLKAGYVNPALKK